MDVSRCARGTLSHTSVPGGRAWSCALAPERMWTGGAAREDGCGEEGSAGVKSGVAPESDLSMDVDVSAGSRWSGRADSRTKRSPLAAGVRLVIIEVRQEPPTVRRHPCSTGR